MHHLLLGPQQDHVITGHLARVHATGRRSQILDVGTVRTHIKITSLLGMPHWPVRPAPPICHLGSGGGVSLLSLGGDAVAAITWLFQVILAPGREKSFHPCDMLTPGDGHMGDHPRPAPPVRGCRWDRVSAARPCGLIPIPCLRERGQEKGTRTLHVC